MLDKEAVLKELERLRSMDYKEEEEVLFRFKKPTIDYIWNDIDPLGQDHQDYYF